MKKVLIIYLIIINCISFYSVSQDKRIAQAPYKTPENYANRTAEVEFVALSAFGGALGTYIGFQVRNHKTSVSKKYLVRSIKWMIFQNILMISFINGNINLRRKKNGERKQFF